MRKDTKNEIIKTAKKLFNEYGFNEVSIGDIAATLGISKGNLTYYFKKKEDIIETIILENPRVETSKIPSSLLELDAFFYNIQKVIQDNAFYFWHYTQLSQISPEIEKKQQEIFRHNFSTLHKAFFSLREAKLLIEEHFKDEYLFLIDSILLSASYWVPFCKLKNAKLTDLSFQHYIWSMVYPLLTAKGRNEFLLIHPKILYTDKK
ncbi:TetR/AcrR family transcriptional regulator [Breznakiella homolactica]|uniref:TetR/AcrR family transcriptional regulator n=1 Tax=Breznakiella homolactica TaxID=2798577 RepID=A0A7T7XP68_9SPIR|nr:TetR/AcrR family transcriptional regulator [Breznakiella homolactica]QQO09923.1 TetR/AcrR family transcriptional regulator [Breznakiella homolactica]